MSLGISRYCECAKVPANESLREQFLKDALSGVAPEEVERRTAEAYREIFGRSDAAE